MTRERNIKQEEERVVTGEMTNRQMHRRITIDMLISRRKKIIIKRFINRPHNSELMIEANDRMRKVNNRSVTRRRARQH